MRDRRGARGPVASLRNAVEGEPRLTLPLTLFGAFVFALVLASSTGSAPRTPPRSIGAAVLCDSCPDPNLNVWGVEWVGQDLWTLSRDGTLTRMTNCVPQEFLLIKGFHGFGTGLGWDSRRSRFIVADALLEEIWLVSPQGDLLQTLPAPGPGSVGAGYDSTRDAIWISDFQVDSLFAVSATTGDVIKRFELPGHQFWAGAAYDPDIDAVYVHDRVLDPHLTCSYFSAETGELLGAFDMPYGALNGYDDNAIGPDGQLWASHDALNRVYCLERQTTAVRPSTWGELKARYRGR